LDAGPEFLVLGPVCVIEDVDLLMQFRCPGSTGRKEIVCSCRGLGIDRLTGREDIVDTKWAHVFGPFDLIDYVLELLPGQVPSGKASIVPETASTFATWNRSHVDTSDIEEFASIFGHFGMSCFGIANKVTLARVGTGNIEVWMSFANVLKHGKFGSKSLSTEVMLEAVEDGLLTSLV
jgi:hypothetical protein